MVERTSVVTGDDGVGRCGWVGSDVEYTRYHDEEWGTPLHGDRPLFEKLSLEAFQSGLSWITILRRRPAFRAAFADFDIPTVSHFNESDVERLVTDETIIRNRAKIVTTIANARVVAEMTEGSPGAFDEFMWSFAPTRSDTRRTLADIPASTPESTALSGALRARGLRFVGPTTMYALMQSTGMVDDHVRGCWRARPA